MTLRRERPTMNIICVDDGEFFNQYRKFGEDNRYCAVYIHIRGRGTYEANFTAAELMKGIARKQEETPKLRGRFARAIRHLFNWPWGTLR